MKNIESIIRSINGTLSLEGIPLDENDMQRLRDLGSGKTTVGKEICNLNEKYLNRQISF